MKAIRNCLLTACLLLPGAPTLASGTLGIYGLIERVVFEPDAEAPQRVQVFGVFAYYDGRPSERSGHTDPARGYLYFSLPARGSLENVRREWADLAAVAGTKEAVAFGSYGYIGQFGAVAADLPSNTVDSRRDTNGFGYPLGLGLGVQAADVAPTTPAEYYPGDLGVVRLGAGNYEALIAEMRALLDE